MGEPSGFRNLTLEYTYDSGFGDWDVMEQFYVPVLASSVTYDRAAGYFSSRVFATAARGISGLIQNGGKMRLVTSHAFTKSDVENFSEYFESREFTEALYEDFEASLKEMGNFEDAVALKHFSAMCWMLREGFLEVKIVIPTSADLRLLSPAELEKFHPKFGIFTDKSGDEIAFSGSVNETASAWHRNIENFDVYFGWDADIQNRYIRPKKVQFQKYWDGIGLGSDWLTIDLPEAVKSKIITSHAPADMPDLATKTPNKSTTVELRSYQEEAIQSWFDSGCRGILEMATGTGKTRTARHAIIRSRLEATQLTVVVVPYAHIGVQWRKELQDLDVFELGANWQLSLENLVNGAQMGRHENITLVTVHKTASSAKYVELIEKLAENFENFVMVGDEVHWLGAPTLQPALFERANRRLGLSATPKRYFDDDGSQRILDYFTNPEKPDDNPVVYTFDIAKALKYRDEFGNPILTNYEYIPIFVEMTKAESEKYMEISRVIGSIKSDKNLSSLEKQTKLETQYIKRAAIAKSAQNKIGALDSLIEGFNKNIDQTLVYCSDTQQMELANGVLKRHKIDTQKITSEESASKSKSFGGVSERDHILQNFASGNLDVLLAIDCLDEGVDIPSARTGILLASSGNEKEFIQRRGRLMRRFPGKEIAQIFDFCVLPSSSSSDSSSRQIRNTELKRIREFAEDAINKSEIDKLITELERQND